MIIRKQQLLKDTYETHKVCKVCRRHVWLLKWAMVNKEEQQHKEGELGELIIHAGDDVSYYCFFIICVVYVVIERLSAGPSAQAFALASEQIRVLTEERKLLAQQQEAEPHKAEEIQSKAREISKQVLKISVESFEKYRATWNNQVWSQSLYIYILYIEPWHDLEISTSTQELQSCGKTKSKTSACWSWVCSVHAASATHMIWHYGWDNSRLTFHTTTSACCLSKGDAAFSSSSD